MRKYEGMFIIKLDIGKEETDNTIKSIEQNITKNGGKVGSLRPWAKRRLAYPIKKQVEGEYYLCDFETEPTAITSLETAYKLNDNILRVLITIKE